jgi:thiol-disulfide isomerase/thioredoxin
MLRVPAVEHAEVAMPRRTTIAVVAVVVAAAVIALVALAGAGGRGLAPEAETGQVEPVGSAVAVIPEADRRPLPAFSAATLDGTRIDLASLRGRPLVLNFWASWCGPCRAEQQGLELAAKDLAGRDVRVVGVNIRDDQGAARSYLKEFGVGYPSLFDRPAVLPARLGDLGPQAPPYTLVVDAAGRVAARVFGALPGGEPKRQAALLTDLVERVTGQ